jgi:hypothetical protein
VREGRPGNLDPEFIADGEVARGEASWVVILGKEDQLVGSMDRTPMGDPSLESSASRSVELAGMLLLQILEQCFGFEPGFSRERLLDVVPHIDKGIDTSAVLAWRLSLRRQTLVVAIRPCGFLVHRSHPGRSGK